MTLPSVRNCNLATRALQAGLIVAILWQTALATLVSNNPPKPRPQSANNSGDQGASTASALKLNDLEPIWKRPLQQTLIAPPPAPKVKRKPPPPPPPVKLPSLAATFVEGGTSWALLTDKSGMQRVRTAGQRIDGFDIEKVVPGAVTLKKQEKTYIVKVAGKSERRNNPRKRRRGR